MDIPTVPGTWYTVASSTTCEITDTATGTPLGKADAGSYSFQAQGNLTTLSDDSALYSKSNFKSAPAKLKALGLLGGGSSAPSLPAGYLAAEFVMFAGNASFDTLIPAVDDVGMRSILTFTWQGDVIFAGARGDGATRCYMSRPYANGYSPAYGWNGWIHFNSDISVGAEEWFTSELNFNNSRAARLITNNSNVEASLAETLTPTGYNIYLGCANIKNAASLFWGGWCKSFQISKGEKIVRDFQPVLKDGKAAFFDKVSKTLFENTQGALLGIGMTLSQAQKLGELPATGGTLNVSLPTGYDSDAGVMSALGTARSNGWTLIIRTYKAETAAATFGMRRIWVRKTQDEHGMYVDADGTRWQVDWCVDMLTPDGSTPDQHGYELFRSTDAAVEYWGLTPWVDPEQEKLLNENPNNE